MKWFPSPLLLTRGHTDIETVMTRAQSLSHVLWSNRGLSVLQLLVLNEDLKTEQIWPEKLEEWWTEEENGCYSCVGTPELKWYFASLFICLLLCPLIVREEPSAFVCVSHERAQKGVRALWHFKNNYYYWRHEFSQYQCSSSCAIMKDLRKADPLTKIVTKQSRNQPSRLLSFYIYFIVAFMRDDGNASVIICFFFITDGHYFLRLPENTERTCQKKKKKKKCWREKQSYREVLKTWRDKLRERRWWCWLCREAMLMMMIIVILCTSYLCVSRCGLVVVPKDTMFLVFYIKKK